jgi:glutamyl-tRNA synthetase
MTVRVRFAPSPSGFLHLGNVRTALFNCLFAKKEKGKFILRIEDTDRERSRQEYVDQTLKDLLWLGVEWDEGPDRPGAFGPYRQSERLPLYQQYAEKFVKEGRAYPCYCTEEELEAMKEAFVARGEPPRYDNRCRSLSASEAEKKRRQGIQPAIRFKIDKDQNPISVFHDLVRGEVRFDLNLFGDFVILRQDKIPTFHLAVCVDDGLMKVTHVIRGEDHLSNTPRHLLLFEALGLSAPQFAHLPLIFGKGNEPLSKRHGAVSTQEYRQLGYLPEALTNYLVLLGWSPGDNRELMTFDELKEAFDLKHVHKAHATFDIDKLNWIAGEKMRSLSQAAFCQKAIEYLREQNLLSETLRKRSEDWMGNALLLFQDSIRFFSELKERFEILTDDFSYQNPEWIKSSEAREIFQVALGILPTLQGEGEGLYDTFMNHLKPKVKAKGKGLFMPLRMALTGKEHGPELKRLLPVLGLEQVRRCLERALVL